MTGLRTFTEGRQRTKAAPLALVIWPDRGQKRLAGPALARQIVDATVRYLKLVAHLGLEGPVYVALSLLGLRGYEMLLGVPYPTSSARPVDRDALIVPEVMVREPPAMDRGPDEANVGRLLRPAFDRVWNACGHPAATVYDTAGNLDIPS